MNFRYFCEIPILIFFVALSFLLVCADLRATASGSWATVADHTQAFTSVGHLDQ